MASRAEMLQICDELDIDREDLTFEDMKEEVKAWADKYIGNSRYMKGETEYSIAFIKFITEEYDYVLEDEEGNEHSWKNL